MRAHSHEINGKLHEDCAECDRIRDAIPNAAREKKADNAAKAHAKVADRTKKAPSDAA